MTQEHRGETDRIRARPREKIRISQTLRFPRTFTIEEKGRVFTAIDFELPFAFEGMQGELPFCFEFNESRVHVFVRTRQKNSDDITKSLRLSDLNPPSYGVIVASGDYCGRINISDIKFQVESFIDPNERETLFSHCLGWVNDLIRVYSLAKSDLRLRQITQNDILAYSFHHLFDGNVFNGIMQPVGELVLQALPEFPNDPLISFSLLTLAMMPNEIYWRLLSEARHYLVTHQYRFAVINSITALESVLSKKILRNFFERHNLSFERWKDNKSRESTTTCLNLFSFLNEMVGLDKGLTERVIEHYHLRNSIVHHGQKNVRAEKAERCVEDVYLLVQNLLDLKHFSMCFRLLLNAMPDSEIEFEVMRMSNPKTSLIMSCHGSLLKATFQVMGYDKVCLKADFGVLGWEVGTRQVIAIIYDANNKTVRLLFNTTEADLVKDCDFGAVDTSLMRYEVRDREHTNFLSMQGSVLLYNRVLLETEIGSYDEDEEDLEDFLYGN